MEIMAEDSFVDVLASGCDAGIRYDERLEQDMIAVPISPRVQRYSTAAAPAYLDLHGRPRHPRDLLAHACLRGRFSSGALTSPWEFEREGEVVRVEPDGPLVVSVGGATDLAIHMAVAGLGVIKGGTPRVVATAVWARDQREADAKLTAWNVPIHRIRARIEKIFGTWKRSYGLRRMRWRGLPRRRPGSLHRNRLQPQTLPQHPFSVSDLSIRQIGIG